MKHSRHTLGQRRGRRGMSLVEVMVVIAMMLGIAAVMVGSYRSLFQVQQRDAARKIATAYQRLQNEALMRNRSYRVRFNLTQNKYVIEAGEAGALIAGSPEDRLAYEETVQTKLKLMGDEDKKAFLHKNRQPFNSLGNDGRLEVEMPRNVFIYGVYTPQYGKMMTRDDFDESDQDDETARKDVQSYILNSGFTEHTVIWITNTLDDPVEGWTVEVEPLSGNTRVVGSLVDYEDAYDWVPDEGPSLPD